jgi:hypothetical protein
LNPVVCLRGTGKGSAVAEERDFDERLATIARELVNEPDMQQPGAGEEAGQELGAVLHPFEAGFHQRGQLGDVVLGQVGQGPFETGPHRLDRVEHVHPARLRYADDDDGGG